MSCTLIRYPKAICASILTLLSLLLWLPRLRGPLDLRWDAGVYYILGTSIAEGKGYRLLNEPGEIQAIQYPPLLPLFAAAHQRIAGSSDPATAGFMLRVSFFLIFLAFIAAVYRLSRHYMTSRLAFLATLAVLLHVHTTWMSELFYAELPFALISVVFFLVSRRPPARFRNAFAGTLAILCFLLRNSGIALLVAWVGESLFTRRFKEMALRACVALLPILAWQGYILHVKNGPEYSRPAYPYQRAAYQYSNVGYLDNVLYVDPFVPELGTESVPLLVRRVFRNLPSVVEGLGAAVSVRREWASFWIRRINETFGTQLASMFLADIVPFVMLGVLVLSGLVLITLRGERLITLYVAGSCGLVCLTPWPGQFERYLWPLTPLLVIALITTLVMICNRVARLAPGMLRTVVLGFVAAIALCVFATESLALRKAFSLGARTFYTNDNGKQHEYRLLFYTPDWQHHDEALEWLGKHANPNDIVATSTPHWAYLKTGLQSVMPPFELDVDEAQRLIDSVPVTYLVLDSFSFVDVSRRYGGPIVHAFPDRWELVYCSPEEDSRIYRRRVLEKELSVSK